jgi:hypothetical protein
MDNSAKLLADLREIKHKELKDLSILLENIFDTWEIVCSSAVFMLICSVISFVIIDFICNISSLRPTRHAK